MRKSHVAIIHPTHARLGRKKQTKERSSRCCAGPCMYIPYMLPHGRECGRLELSDTGCATGICAFQKKKTPPDSSLYSRRPPNKERKTNSWN